MSAISTAGARIDRWDNGRPAHREQARLIEALKLERSSRYLCSEGFITFISKPHDDDAALILAPYRLLGIHVNLLAGGDGHRRQAARRIRDGTRGAEGGRDVQGEWVRLLPGAVDPATDDRLLPAGFTPRARGLASRP